MRGKLVIIFATVLLCYLSSSFGQTNVTPAQTSVSPDSTTANPTSTAPDPKDAVPNAQPAGAVVQDPAGRPVQTSTSPEVPPPPAATAERENFQQNVRDVYFDFDRANLTADDRATLQKDAEWIKAHPNLYFTIAGGADERGSIPYNLFLSDQRALVTRDALVKLGVPGDQILFATGWGKLYPVCEQADESCWSQNRRSHLAAWPPPPQNPLGQAAENQRPTAPVKTSSSAAGTN